MNSINLSSLLLFLAVVLLAVFLGGKEINTRIEETIETNYKAEIDALKEKLDKQSELLNSIINLGNKNDEDDDNSSSTDNIGSGNTDEKPKDEPADAEPEFEYIKENGGITITGYNGKQTNVKIPERIEQLPVLKIGENAFSETKVKSVTLPSSCVEVDWFAFYGCYALSSVYIPDGIETIGYGAFDSCSKGLTIYGERNSYAQKYAQSFGISFSVQ